MTLRLSWKRSPKDSVHLIGVYELDLRRLLTAGYVRIEPKTENEIRLRFYHGYDDVIYIQVNSKEPELSVGRMKSLGASGTSGIVIDILPLTQSSRAASTQTLDDWTPSLPLRVLYRFAFL